MNINSSLLRSYEIYFAPVAESIYSISLEYGVHLDKYHQDAPCWSLLFRHPKGGVAKIDFAIKNGNSIGISGIWWKDEYETGTRAIKWFEEEVIAKNETAIRDRTSVMFKKILNHPVGTWSKILTGYGPLWHPFGRDFVEGEERRYPLPLEKTN